MERTLRALFAPDPPSLNDLREPVPLAVELSLSAGPPAAALWARVVRPGRTGWVSGGLSWRNVASHYSLGDCVPAHVRVLRELYALHSAGNASAGYAYGGYDRTIDLAAVGRGLWSVLDEAADVGLQVVHPRKRLGAVDRYTDAELCLDVTAGPTAEALEIAPALRFGSSEEAETDALPILFLGAEGHGVVYVSRAEADPDATNWFRLARLAVPAPPALRRPATGDTWLAVPADQRARFLDEFYPRLSRLAPAVSSDGSFTPPPVAAPELVLRAAYGDGHVVRLDWEWAYPVGDARLRFPLSPLGPGRGCPGSAAGAGGARHARAVFVRDGAVARRRSGIPAPAAGRAARARHHAVHHRGPAPARRTAGVVVEVERRAGRLPGGRRLAADRGVHRRVRRRAPTGSTSACASASRAATCRSPTCSWRWPRGSRSCCCPTAPTSRCTSPSCRRCAS